MALKAILCALVLALLASIGWRCRQSELIQSWTRIEHESRPIVFDNGTAREVAPSAPSSGPIGSPTALHTLRRCQRGSEVVYTDNPCQQGFREQPVSRGSVSFLGGQTAPRGAASASPQPLPQSTLREVLGDSGNAGLRDKRIERAIGEP
jgi:hypothetical protein